MLLRLTGFLILATVVAVPAQAQGIKPRLEPAVGPLVFRTLGASTVDPVVVSPRNRLGSISLEGFLKRLPPVPRTEVACPMPVVRPRPRSADSMPVLPTDSTTAPAVNQRVVLPACRNDYAK
jgi:hypothetical protein